MKPILPGATIGMLGGGQLGRMTALAAVGMGYKIRAIDPDPDCPIRSLTEECITAPWHDAEAFARLARECDVVTYEIEKIPKTSLDQVERFAPLRPGAHVLRIVQDRLKQKEWLSRRGFPVAKFLGVKSADDVIIATGAFRGAGFLKTTQGGYDGRSQIRIPDATHLAGAWKDLGELPCILESAIPFESELSVLVARQEGGEGISYEPSLNAHRAGILDWAVLPGDVSTEVSRTAQELAQAIAEKIDLCGLLVVEMFKLPGGSCW
jgi:5-(carboxyamino)imidazole ribonucleotide synthase